MKKAIILISLINLQLFAFTQVVWERSNLPLYPNYLKVVLTSPTSSKTYSYEIDLENQVVLMEDEKSIFEVTGYVNYQYGYAMARDLNGDSVKHYLNDPLDKPHSVYELYRSLHYDDYNLNDVVIHLRHGKLYTRSRDSKKKSKKFKSKEVQGKIVSLEQNKVTLLLMDGTFLTFYDYQVEKLSIQSEVFSGVVPLYLNSFENYSEYVITQKQAFEKGVKNMSVSTAISHFGAVESTIQLGTDQIVSWTYDVEVYYVNINTTNISAESSTTTNYMPTGSVYKSTYSFGNDYLETYYEGNLQQRSSSLSRSSSQGYSRGTVKKETIKISVSLRIDQNGQVIEVMQKGIIQNPQRGLGFSFYY